MEDETEYFLSDLEAHLCGDITGSVVRDDIDIDIDKLIKEGTPTASDVVHLFGWISDAADRNHPGDLAAFITFHRLMKDMKPIPLEGEIGH